MGNKLSTDLIWQAAKASTTPEEFFQLINQAVEEPVIVKYRFDHLAIPVSDPQGSLEWYQSVFDDVEILYQDDEWVFLQTGGIKLAFVNSALHPAHFSFEVDEETLNSVADKLDLQVEQQRPDTLSLFLIGGPGDICVELVHYLVEFDEEDD